MRHLSLLGPMFIASIMFSQAQEPGDSPALVSVDASAFVLNHVRVIDGTAVPAKEDQAIVVVNGKIEFIDLVAAAQIPQGAQQLERLGYTVIPGLVGMHNHLYYTDSYSDQLGATGTLSEPGLFIAELRYSAPQLCLSAGVTSLRATSSVEPYTAQDPTVRPSTVDVI